MVHISVIVPFYNSRRYIGSCIDGLLLQSYPAKRYEIIMIDNNSTDGSAEIVRQHPRIRLLHEPKQGAYVARNRGLAEANGEIIAFTDADCVPFPDWLEKIVGAMGEPDVGVVLGKCRFAGRSALLSMLAAYEHENDNYLFNSGIKELYYGHTNNMAVRKKLFDELGPFVERNRGADTIFVRHCVDRYSCAAIRYHPEVQVRHMEIDSLRALYRKYYIYGSSSRDYGRIVQMGSSTNQSRALVFSKVVQSQAYSRMESVVLFGLLVIRVLCRVLGNISAAWNWQRTTSANVTTDERK